MQAFFSPSKQYRYGDAIAASFYESRQTAEPRDLLVREGVAVVVTIGDVTKRRILVVDCGAKIPGAARTPWCAPHNQAHAVEVLTMQGEECLSDYLVGRICYMGMET